MDDHELFLDVAKAYAKQSTCLRRKYGAVIVDPIKRIQISGGFNGAPRGMLHCTDLKQCMREELKIKPGERYELCNSLHAEQNAIIQAGNRSWGCNIYLFGFDNKTMELIEPIPCFLCTKMMINAGIDRVITPFGVLDPVDLYLDYYNKLYATQQ